MGCLSSKPIQIANVTVKQGTTYANALVFVLPSLTDNGGKMQSLAFLDELDTKNSPSGSSIFCDMMTV